MRAEPGLRRLWPVLRSKSLLWEVFKHFFRSTKGFESFFTCLFFLFFLVFPLFRLLDLLFHFLFFIIIFFFFFFFFFFSFFFFLGGGRKAPPGARPGARAPCALWLMRHWTCHIRPPKKSWIRENVICGHCHSRVLRVHVRPRIVVTNRHRENVICGHYHSGILRVHVTPRICDICCHQSSSFSNEFPQEGNIFRNFFPAPAEKHLRSFFNPHPTILLRHNNIFQQFTSHLTIRVKSFHEALLYL